MSCTKMFTRFSSIMFPRYSIVRRVPIRLNTTASGPQDPPAAKAPEPAPAKPQAASSKAQSEAATGKGKEPGKGKGPIIWKSLSFVLVGGAGLLVCKLFIPWN